MRRRKFITAKEFYGVWPLTIWPVNVADREYKDLKAWIGDKGQARGGCFKKKGDRCFSTTASIFNPLLCRWILRCYAPRKGLCLDPFSGGGTRAVMAAEHGMSYWGVELRGEEAKAARRRIKRCGFSANAKILKGDSAKVLKRIEGHSADFLYTCPPYFDLERYHGGKADLSMFSEYADFLSALFDIVKETHRLLKPGAYSCWVVGLHRYKNGNLFPLNHDIARLHREAGFIFKEEIIVDKSKVGCIQRLGNFERGRRFLIRAHEYVLVFVKGEQVTPQKAPTRPRGPAGSAL